MADAGNKTPHSKEEQNVTKARKPQTNKPANKNKKSVEGLEQKGLSKTEDPQQENESNTEQEDIDGISDDDIVTSNKSTHPILREHPTRPTAFGFSRSKTEDPQQGNESNTEQEDIDGISDDDIVTSNKSTHPVLREHPTRPTAFGFSRSKAEDPQDFGGFSDDDNESHQITPPILKEHLKRLTAFGFSRYIKDHGGVLLCGTVMVVCFIWIIWKQQSLESRLNEHEKMMADVLSRKDLFATLEKLNNSVPAFDVQMKDVEKRFAPFKNQFDALERNVHEITKNTSDLANNINTLNLKSSKLNIDHESQRQSVTKLTESINTLTQDEGNIKGTLKTLNTDVSEIKISYELMSNHLTKLEDNVTKCAWTVEEITPKLDQADKTLSSMVPIIDKYENKFDKVEQIINKTQDFAGKLENLTSQTQKTEELGQQTIKTITELQGRIKTSEGTLWNINEISHGIKEELDVLKETRKGVDNNLQSQKERLSALDDKVTDTDNDVRSKMKTLAQDVKGKTNEMQTLLGGLKEEISTARHQNTDCVKNLQSINETVNTLNATMMEVDSLTDYTREKLPDVDSRLRTLEGKLSSSWSFWLSIAQTIVMMCFLSTWIGSLRSDTYTSVPSVLATKNQKTSSLRNQSFDSILNKIHRPTILDNKICVISFYSETQSLHKSLVESAIEGSRRGKSMEIVYFHVSCHEDILRMPKCRYILIFVDYNERNVILENPDQDLGDKKMLTVQAAMKIADKVCVTYIKDKGSRNLNPGQLYNLELAAFTTHPVLKTLNNRDQCFSVYDQFNTTQKEHIAKMIV